MPQLVSSTCPECNAPLSVPDDRPRFFCQFCGTQVERANGQPRTTDDPDASPVGYTGPKPPVPIPEKLQIEDDGGDLTIRWRWFTPGILFLIPFAVAWNAFLVGWYAMAMGFGGDMPGPMRLIFLVFPIAHVAVGLGLTYAILTGIFNRTTVQVRNGLLRIRQAPIWYPGGRSLPVDDIEQLYCSQGGSTYKHGRASLRVSLHARLKSGRSVQLIQEAISSGVFVAVEQLVEKHLGIDDAPVAGEATLPLRGGMSNMG